MELAKQQGYEVDICVLPYGVRGFSTKVMVDSMKKLGIRPTVIKEHKIKTGRHNIFEGINLLWLRNRLEANLKDKTRSGKHRLKVFRTLQRKYQKKYPPDGR